MWPTAALQIVAFNQFDAFGHNFKASDFPGFNGSAAMFTQFQLYKVQYRIRLEFNTTFQYNSFGTGISFPEPTCYCAEVNDTILDPSQVASTTAATLLQYSNCKLWRGTQASAWRTCYTRQFAMTTNTDGTAAGYNGYSSIPSGWSSTNLPNIQHSPCLYIGSDFVQNGNSTPGSPPNDPPRIVLEAKGFFRFRNPM